MNREQALSFLRDHQPMPGDADVDRDLVEKYAEVRRYFLRSPDRACIPLFLSSFGEGSCFGVYQLVEDVIRQFPGEEVVPHLLVALSSAHRSVRYWTAQIAACFPAPELVPELEKLLDEDDFDLRYATVTALEQIDDRRVSSILQRTLERETNEEMRDLLRDALSVIVTVC